MSPDMQTQLFNAIQELYDEAYQAYEEPWSVNMIQKLIPFVPFNKISKIQGCFLFALDHQSVFPEPAEPLTDIPEENTHQQHLIEALQGYTWQPKAQLEKLTKSPTSTMNKTYFSTKISNIYRT